MIGCTCDLQARYAEYIYKYLFQATIVRSNRLSATDDKSRTSLSPSASGHSTVIYGRSGPLIVLDYIWHLAALTFCQLEMNSILRARSPHASVLPVRRTAHRLTARRPYTLSSYGGENQNVSGKRDEANSRETKEREHPGRYSSRPPTLQPTHLY